MMLRYWNFGIICWTAFLEIIGSAGASPCSPYEYFHNRSSEQTCVDMRWCQYRFYRHPRSWNEAREICAQDNMELCHITDRLQHNFLTSLIQSSLPAIYANPPSNEIIEHTQRDWGEGECFHLWLGLFQPEGGQAVWQDNCETIRDGYNPIPDTVNTSEICFMFDANNHTYRSEACSVSQQFICYHSESVTDLNTCIAQTLTVNDAHYYPRVFDITSSYFECMAYCTDPYCVGFSIAYSTKCARFSYWLGHTYTKGGSNKYVKALMITSSVSILKSVSHVDEICGTAATSSTNQGFAFTETPFPEAPSSMYSSDSEGLTTYLSVLSSYPDIDITNTSQVLTSPLNITSLSMPLDTTTPTVNLVSDLEVRLDDLSTRIDSNTSITDIKDITAFSKEMVDGLLDDPKNICSNVNKVIKIESKIVNKSATLSSENYNLTSSINSFLQTANIIYGYYLPQIRCGESLQQADVLRLEDAIQQNAKLLLKWTNSSKHEHRFEHNGTSFYIVLEDGNNIQERYTTSYGSLIFQHSTSLRKRLKDQRLMIMVLSYFEDPLRTASNLGDQIHLPVVTTAIFNEDGSVFTDLNEGYHVAIHAEHVLEPDNNSITMFQIDSGYIAAFPSGFFNKTAALISVDLSMKSSCKTYGIYGTSIPSKDNFAFLIHTKSASNIEKYRPYGLVYSYQDGLLQLKLRKTPAVILIQCQALSTNKNDNEKKMSTQASTLEGSGMSTTHIASNSLHTTLPTQRITQELTCYRTITTPTETSNKKDATPTMKVILVEPKLKSMTSDNLEASPYVKLTVGTRSEIALHSMIFGQVSASFRLILPDMINFGSVFSDFSEKVITTPYVLATVVTLVIVLLIMTILMRRLDNVDTDLWNYEFLEDNKSDAQFLYYLTVSTGIRSQSKLVSNVYVNIIGSRAKTGPRLLSSGNSKNLRRGTTSTFCLSTEKFLGDALKIQIWEDVEGPFSSLFLTSILLVDGTTRKSYPLKCNKWLSLEKGTGKTWHTIDATNHTSNDDSLSEACTQRMFDDNLWFSLVFRPRYSHFTRVQRLWNVISFLVFSMLTSAMFYNTTDPGIPLVKFSSFEIHYRDTYISMVSNAISVVPNMIVGYIFRNRKLRGEKSLVVLHEGETIDQSRKLPWWSIFIGYGLMLVCLNAGSFFTVLYSLEWGPTLTLKWMSSFFLGVGENITIFEPVKVLSLAVILMFTCSDGISRKVFPPIFTQRLGLRQPETLSRQKRIIECPCDKPLTEDQYNHRLLLRNKKKLHRLIKEFLKLMVYVVLLLLISSHQKTSEVFRQNTNIMNTVKPMSKISTIEDAWRYLQTIQDRLSPTTFYNRKMKSYDQLRFSGVNYKLGPLRFRQVRIKGSCSIPSVMRNVMPICLPDYSEENEDTLNYFEGWNLNTGPNASICSPFKYRSGDQTGSSFYTGKFGTYSGNGYVMDFDIDPVSAAEEMTILKAKNWLNEKTRVLFVEVLLLNRNNMLFSQVQLVLEFPSPGGVFFDSVIHTSNLYPYIDFMDYAILLCQMLFIIIIAIKIVAVIVRGVRTKCHYLHSLDGAVQVFEVVVSVAAVIFFILRFITTIDALNMLQYDEGFLTSFGMVFTWDKCYSVCLGVIIFKSILDLLKPMSINYHLHLMMTSIRTFGNELYQFTFLLLLIITGFASFIFLIYGYIEDSFRSIPKGISTLFQMALGMIQFRRDLRLHELGTFIIFGLYAFTVTMVMMNFFISALNVVISEKKCMSKRKRSSFDWKLNRYIWRILKSPFSSNKPKKNNKYCGTKKEVDTQKAEKRFVRFCTKLTWYAVEDMILEREFFKNVFLPKEHFRGKNFLWSKVRKTNNSIQYRFSTTSFDHDDDFIIEFQDTNQSLSRIDVKRTSIYKANENGLIPYGISTRFISEFSITYTNDIFSGCRVMLKVDAYEVSSGEVFIVTSFGDYSPWQQFALDKWDHNKSYFVAELPSCPKYAFAVTCSLWPGVPSSVRNMETEKFQISRDPGVICPSSYNHLTLTFPKETVRSTTTIKIQVATRHSQLLFRILSSESIPRPIKVKCDWKGNRYLGIEHLMDRQVLTKDGDQEWRAENTELIEQFDTLTFYISDIKRRVTKSVGVFLSDFKISFGGAEKLNLGTEYNTLLEIYGKKIRSKHWRCIGQALGVSHEDLLLLENSKPRSSEEKAAMLCRGWLKKHPSQSLQSIKEIWN